MGVDRSGHMELGASDHDAVRPTFGHMNILIRIGLLRRAFGAITLGIGHGTDHHAVIVLDPGQPAVKALQIVGAQLFINFIDHRVNGIDTVKADAALETGACFLTQHPQQLHFFDQILDILMHMGKTADRTPRQVRCGCCQLPVFFSGRQRVRHGGRPYMRGGGRVPRNVIDAFAFVIDDGLQGPQAFDILTTVLQFHDSLLRDGFRTTTRILICSNRPVPVFFQSPPFSARLRTGVDTVFVCLDNR